MIHATDIGPNLTLSRDDFICAAHIILVTNQKVLIPHGQYDHWLRSPSIQALRKYTSTYIGKKARKCDLSPTCTHYLEVAHFMANCQHLYQRYPRDVLAFIGYAHDLVEDLGRKTIYNSRGEPMELVTPENITRRCWKGDPCFKTLITEMIHLLTDPKKLKGWPRLSLQITVANEDAKEIVRYARYADKYCTYFRDLACFSRNGTHPDKGIPDYLKNMEMRQKVVEGLHIPEEYIKRFIDITDQIKWVMDGQMKEKPGKAFKAYFRPNSLPPTSFKKNAGATKSSHIRKLNVG